jgi:hypothetical protein
MRLGDCFVRRRTFGGRALQHPNRAISQLELVRANVVGADTRMGSFALSGLPDFGLWAMDGENVVTLA